LIPTLEEALMNQPAPHPWLSIAAAVPGRAGAPSEDTALAHPAGDTVVVADGLGSTGLGRRASALAAELVLTVVRHLAHEGAALPLLEAALLATYRVRVDDDRRAATTCLFAIAGPSRVVVGQVGDGVLAVIHADGEVTRLPAGRGDFGDETEALPRTAPRVVAFAPGDVEAVLLASEGVSDDLTPGDEGELARGFTAICREHGRARAAEALRAWLTDWPTPGSRDDRSVALLVRPNGAAGA